jgi:O-acetyl-ADP-ribose deacetylase (regulator of RNase III)
MLKPAGSPPYRSGSSPAACGRLTSVIHAVGPVYDSTLRSAELLGSAVRAALQVADNHGLRSIALPAISTGIFGYPMEEAAQVMLQAAIAYLEGETGLSHVFFCLYSQAAFDVFARELASQAQVE